MSSERGEYDVEGCPKLWEEELELAEELKNCCELKEQSQMLREKKSDLNKSGKILHKLGLVYKRRAVDFLWKLNFALSVIKLIESPNTPITRDIRNTIPRIRTSIRFAFVRSAALINAAIVRNPSNVKEIGKDLDELYRLVLEVANAKQVNYKIKETIQFIAKKVDYLKSQTSKNLEKLENIPENISDEEVRERQKGKTKFMKKLQTLVSQFYADMMKYISSEIEQIMGNLPCRYAIVGMGSLAREEITPFSDFEHIILLEDDVFKNMNEDDDSVETESVIQLYRKHENVLSESEKAWLKDVVGNAIVVTSATYDEGLSFLYSKFNSPHIDVKLKLHFAGMILKELRSLQKRDDEISDFVKNKLETLNPRKEFVILLELHYMYGSYLITVLRNISEASKIFLKMLDYLLNLESWLPTFQKNRKKELEVCLHKYKPACYIGLGRCDYENGRYDSAIDKFKKYETELDVSIEPSLQYRGLAYSLISHCYVCKNEPRAAKEYCEKALKFMKNQSKSSVHLVQQKMKHMELRKELLELDDPIKFQLYRLYFMQQEGLFYG
ncbi:unnamed protein product [Clavelina lepadiformis]|uniref:Protein-PII uridylyltransferase N-terminal domain-containing protein n=1 Tax=Clavelina lepadiformis TaxID=159417 RepID=A0ABP0FQ49_CLALP